MDSRRSRQIGSNLIRIARITPDASGSYEFFRAAAAPDAGDVMVCTTHHNLSSNEFTLKLFRSTDGGEKWVYVSWTDRATRSAKMLVLSRESGKAYLCGRNRGTSRTLTQLIEHLS